MVQGLREVYSFAIYTTTTNPHTYALGIQFMCLSCYYVCTQSHHSKSHSMNMPSFHLWQNHLKNYMDLEIYFNKLSMASNNSNQFALTCHFLTIDRSLSVVRSMPWKFVSTFLPCTSSAIRRNLRNERSASLSFCKSAKDTSNTLYFRPSDAISIKQNLITV